MQTRKLFAMGYQRGRLSVNEEACRGDCYAYSLVLDLRQTGWSTAELKCAGKALLGTHARICGNGNFRLGVDLDERLNLFFGSFYHYGAQETCVGASILQVIEELAEIAGRYFDSEQYKLDMQSDPGLGRSACAHGDDAALVDWMLKAGNYQGDHEQAAAMLLST